MAASVLVNKEAMLFDNASEQLARFPAGKFRLQR